MNKPKKNTRRSTGDFETAWHELPEEYDAVQTLLHETQKFFPQSGTQLESVWRMQHLIWYLQNVQSEQLLSGYTSIAPEEVQALEARVAQVVATLPTELQGDVQPLNTSLNLEATLDYFSQWESISSVAQQVSEFIRAFQKFGADHQSEVLSRMVEMDEAVKRIQAQIVLLQAEETKLTSALFSASPVIINSAEE